MRTRLVLPLSVITALLFVGAGCSLLGSSAKPVALKPVTLTYWRATDSADALAPGIEAYRKLHPNVTISVKTLREEDFDKTLLEAFAKQEGPDIFSVENVRLGEWKAKILPIPKETQVATQTVNDKKQIVTEKKKVPALSLIDLNARYVEGIARELTMPFPGEKPESPPIEKIAGIPYSADSLALFYNRDILKKSTIEKPPLTWRDLQEHAIKLTIIEEPATNAGATASADPNADANFGFGAGPAKVIKQSGAALGLARNIDYAADILTTLMAQNGAKLADENGTPAFYLDPPGIEGFSEGPGAAALQFYQSFAISGAQNFSWNATLPRSIDAFISGKTAYYFGLPGDAANIRERAPKLDFGLAPMPQVDPSNARNLLRYPVEVVSKRTKNPDEAWDFLQFMAQPDQVTEFLTATKRPTALRALIAGQMTDPDIAPFAGQVLTAKSWYTGVNWDAVDEAFAAAITTYPTLKQPSYRRILDIAAGEVGATYR